MDFEPKDLRSRFILSEKQWKYLKDNNIWITGGLLLKNILNEEWSSCPCEDIDLIFQYNPDFDSMRKYFNTVLIPSSEMFYHAVQLFGYATVLKQDTQSSYPDWLFRSVKYKCGDVTVNMIAVNCNPKDFILKYFDFDFVKNLYNGRELFISNKYSIENRKSKYYSPAVTGIYPVVNSLPPSNMFETNLDTVKIFNSNPYTIEFFTPYAKYVEDLKDKRSKKYQQRGFKILS